MKTRQIATSGSPHPIVRAFRVDVTDWPDATSIVMTSSPSKAKYDAWNSARDAGCGLGFHRFKVLRAPQFDRKKLVPRRCYGIDYALAAEDIPNV